MTFARRPSGTPRSLRRLRAAPVEFRRWRHNQAGQFVFIHINKTGGSSVEAALGVPLEHYTAREKIAQIGETAWDERYTFSIVRNPFDRLVSHYSYRLTRNHQSMRDTSVDFAEWVRLVLQERDPTFRDEEKMFIPQIEWLVDDSGSILVDDVLRFEDLPSAFARIAGQLQVEVSLPHTKPSRRRDDYRDYFDAETKQIAERAFGEDLERLGYDFDA